MKNHLPLLPTGAQRTRGLTPSERQKARRRPLIPVKWTAMLSLAFCLSFSYGHAQDPEYIQGWTTLEEADFYFDVTYAVVKCSPDASPVILLNAFNEGGNVASIGLVLELSDANGNESTIEIPTFAIAFGEMQIASCESSENDHLKFDVPDGMDAASLSIEVTYEKGS